MSSSHHGSAQEEAKDRFISEMLSKAKPSFPQGRVHESDRGETAFAIAADPRRGIVINALCSSRNRSWINARCNRQYDKI